ncbi:MAG: anti-sigma-factor antagonist [Acidimicrobiia bacterium]|nr:anti-sigma-factor antagonist [Acidimicrobiia bacterium]
MNEIEQALTISTTDDGGRRIIAVAGEIDVHTCSELEDAVRKGYGSGGTQVVLDVAGVGFIDSSGLRSLITLQQEAAATEGALQLRSPSRPVLRLLEVTGLTSMFPVVES